MLAALPKKQYLYSAALIIAAVVIGLWEPHALIYGVQRGSLYAVIALPLALILGILGVLNLAHGEFLTVGLYTSYVLFNRFGTDPLKATIPVTLFLAVVGVAIYLLTIKHVLKAGHLSQLLITFGISLVLSELVKSIYTTQPRAVFTTYSHRSTTLAGIRFGIYEFLYLLIAVTVLVGLQLFLKKTRLGQATFAVGQNPTGASIVGINVGFVYMFVFGLSMAIVGLASAVMVPRVAIFPGAGTPFTMKSFALSAMAGLGNLNGILLAGLTLGIFEAVVNAIPGGSGWSDVVFFGVLILVILTRSFREAK
ncbi:MAG TPA: branched-chain amino acid ABC transporter permease [Firmicutes bacterium]|nr:branched-chain amino acid ABC transporter permease [Bacillota bacterium]